jgi:hypothetical protein
MPDLPAFEACVLGYFIAQSNETILRQIPFHGLEVFVNPLHVASNIPELRINAV